MKYMRNTQSFMENPFRVDGLEMRQYVQKTGEQLMIDPNTEELLAVRRVGKSKEHLSDTKVYTKLFTDNLDTIMELPAVGLKILYYAMCKVKPLKDDIFLNPDDCMLVCGFKSVTSYRDGIKSLIENQIIAKTVGSNIRFWINPNIFFNGNRLRLI